MNKLEPQNILGATYQKDAGTFFRIWAPFHNSLAIQIEGKGFFPMQEEAEGYFTCQIEDARPGDCYFFVFENGDKRPDPVSRLLPKGVHGPTEIVDPLAFAWKDQDWQGIDKSHAIFYEVHVGTFSPEGTFEGAIKKLDYLKHLGINCIELMPVVQFPGRWNWGYDGASPYAPAVQYGGPQGLKKLVNAAHLAKIAVCLDVVYNHLGPIGNYLESFGPYFSSAYHTPWGKGFNYDGAYSDHVRAFVIQNALYWFSEYHVDFLRLDAIHGIYDMSAEPMLLELTKAVKTLQIELKRRIWVVAESDANNARTLRSEKQGGLEIDGLWHEDYHHAAHVALTGEKTSYYQDFAGIEDIAYALKNGFVYDGKYSAFRKKRQGNYSKDIEIEKFIVFTQNHDQVGNRPFGDRLSKLISSERLKLAPFLSLMTPSPCLLFMGEEYGEKAPFEYFTDFEEEELMHSVHTGRKKEFSREDMPFPGHEAFERSHLTWEKDPEIFAVYQKLIEIRKEFPALQGIKRRQVSVFSSTKHEWLAWEYPTKKNSLGILCHFGKEKPLEIKLPFKKAKTLLYATQNLKFPSENTCIFSPENSAIFID